MEPLQRLGFEEVLRVDVDTGAMMQLFGWHACAHDEGVAQLGPSVEDASQAL